jgi:hypothetical protein
MEKNGLVSFIVHPDYVIEKKAMDVYRDLLTYLSELRQRRRLWFALPGEIDRWWRARNEMRIVGREGDWRIEGEDAGRARLGFAQRVGDRLEYKIAS